MRPRGRRPYLVCATFLVAVGLCASCARSDRQQRQQQFEARQAKIEARGSPARAGRRRLRPRMTTPEIQTHEDLGDALGASPWPIEAPCLTRFCTRRSLDRLFEKLDQVDSGQDAVARILLLGDSHIAADYIARTVRDRLQHRFGSAGRGFVVIDQKAQYGGRRLSKAYWSRLRIVDGGGFGKAFGFAGMRLMSNRPGARMAFELEDEDDEVVAYFIAGPDSGTLSFFVHDQKVSQIMTRMDGFESAVHRFDVPTQVDGVNGAPRRLEIVAQSPNAMLLGLSFESDSPGVILDAVGPVGADANTWLHMNRRSLQQHLRALDPDLVMLMIGGNDALAVRKRDRTMREVEMDYRALIERIKTALPSTDCLLWAPLDAGVRVNGHIASKPDLPQIRDIQRRVAQDLQCAFWDTYEAMGGEGSFRRWFKQGLMNSDLVHPRSRGGDLLGHLFSSALIDLYVDGS